MLRKVDNVVFLSDELNIRAGGPCGYVANLKKALEEYGGSASVAFISKRDVAHLMARERRPIPKEIARALTCWVPIKKYRKQLRQRILSLIWQKGNIDYLDVDAEGYTGYAEVLDQLYFKTITCHCTRDAIFIRNYLTARQQNAKLLLMSHSPELPSQEMYHGAKLNGNLQAESIYRLWQGIERKAFDVADVLVFPTKEAMEPYISGAEYFQDLIRGKEIQFVTTGCEKIDSSKSSIDIRERYNVATKYIVSFIGRHTNIKGYDKLKEIASAVLAARDDVTFVIGGTQSEEFAPLSHPRWIELGRVNPADVLKVSDLFILPNRQTYFDLVLLEVLSAGVPVIASNTGGNKSVYAATRAIDLYDTTDDCVTKINCYLDSTEEFKNQKRALSSAAYANAYTLKHFAENYLELISRVTI